MCHTLDFNLDGHVNILDINIIVSEWGKAETQSELYVNNYIRRDINRNGNINLSDVSILLS